MTQWDEKITRCDQCRRTLSVPNMVSSGPPPLPDPWREVSIAGWVGTWHACSARCEEGIRERHPSSMKLEKSGDGS